MSIDFNILIPLFTFVVIAFASESISKFFAKIHFPLISGLIFTGVVVGPYVLKIITGESLTQLMFLLDVALAFIAMAAGNELHLEELKDSFKSIKYNTIFQLIFTFLISALGIYLLADIIPFLRDMNNNSKIAISALLGTIFIARSPSSAIAIIKELRAKGSFVSTAIGVIVLIDVLVVIFFAITFSISESVIDDIPIDIKILLLIVLELILAVVIAFVLAKIMQLILSIKISNVLKIIVIIFLGYSSFLISGLILKYSHHFFNVEVFVEPILIALLASFYITNFTDSRSEFSKILHNNGAWIYVIFFTLTGAALSLDLFVKVWEIALILFIIRIVGLGIGSVFGGWAAGNSPKHIKYGWMPHLTQAGIGIGLATEIVHKYPDWGNEAFTIIIAVIVLSQIVGPPLFKLAVIKVGEAHIKAVDHVFDGEKDLLIFGYENQSIAIARNLESNGWNVKIATFIPQNEHEHYEDVEIVTISSLDFETMKFLEADKIEAALLLFSSDDRNYKISELLYEHFGTREIVVRINERENYKKFKKLNCFVVDPSNAMINLLMQYVKSPHSTSLLLGELKGQNTMDIEIRDPSVVGKYIRSLRLPEDIIILSLERDNHTIITHGNTQLEMGDIITVVGSEESLDMLLLKCSVV